MNASAMSALPSVQQKLSKSLDKLNALWADVNERLRKLNLPVFADCVTEDPCGNHFVGLSWQKWHREWQVCLYWYADWAPEDATSRPILECTANERRAYLCDVPRLVDAMLAAAERFSAAAETEIEAFKAQHG